MASIIATNVLNPINASHCWANNGSLQPIVNGLRIIQLESNEKINNCKDPLFNSITERSKMWWEQDVNILFRCGIIFITSFSNRSM